MEEVKTEVESIFEGILDIEKDYTEELSNKLHNINEKSEIIVEAEDAVDTIIADTINDKKEKKMSMKELAEKLVELSFASSNAYTEAVESEDRIARLERIQKAMNQMQFKESLANEELYRDPRPLK